MVNTPGTTPASGYRSRRRIEALLLRIIITRAADRTPDVAVHIWGFGGTTEASAGSHAHAPFTGEDITDHTALGYAYSLRGSCPDSGPADSPTSDSRQWCGMAGGITHRLARRALPRTQATSCPRVPPDPPLGPKAHQWTACSGWRLLAARRSCA